MLGMAFGDSEKCRRNLRRAATGESPTASPQIIVAANQLSSGLRLDPIHRWYGELTDGDHIAIGQMNLQNAKRRITMAVFVSDRALTKVQESAHPLSGSREDYDPLIEMIGNARYV